MDILDTENPAILDPSAINTLREMSVGQNEKFIKEFIDLYLRRTGESIDRILEFGESEDSVALRATAHKLPGASLNVGGMQVAAICGVLEKKTKKQDLAGVDELVQSLKDAYHALSEALAFERSR